MKISWEKFKKNIHKFDSYRGSKSVFDGKQQFDRGKNSPVQEDQAKHDKKLKILYITFFIWAFTIGFYIILFSGFSQLSTKIVDKINLSGKNSFSIYKPGIDILNSLQGSSYIKYIHRLYVHPKEENKMMIMIKPNYWGIIDHDEKEKIKSEILKKWEKLYKNSDPEEFLKPEAHFANT